MWVLVSAFRVFGCGMQSLGISQVAQWQRPRLPSRRGRFDPWVGRIPWKRKQQPHSSTLAWEIRWTEDPGRLRARGHREPAMTQRRGTHVGTLSCCMRDLVPQLGTGWNPGPQHWELGVLTTGPPGKSLQFLLSLAGVHYVDFKTPW